MGKMGLGGILLGAAAMAVAGAAASSAASTPENRNERIIKNIVQRSQAPEAAISAVRQCIDANGHVDEEKAIGGLSGYLFYLRIPQIWDEEYFENFENIRSIVLPLSVKNIGANAFKDCKNLESISVANEKIIVNTDAFKGCENLNDEAKLFVEKFSDMVFVSGFENDGDSIPSFYIAKYLVTQELYESVMGENPSFFKGERLPVENVSFRDAALFCNKLSEKHGITPCYTFGYSGLSCNFKANGYRLPTVTEWRHAARNKSKGYFSYSGSDIVDEVAWYAGNSDGRTHSVGEKKANALGIYDMSGNVHELSQPFGGFIYESGEGHISILGGAYNCIDTECVISAMKYYSLPDKKRGNRTGFRIVRNCGDTHYEKCEKKG